MRPAISNTLNETFIQHDRLGRSLLGEFLAHKSIEVLLTLTNMQLRRFLRAASNGSILRRQFPALGFE